MDHEEIIKGAVKKGRGLGRKLGFPTLNIPYSGDIDGVFAAWVQVDGLVVGAAVHVGPRPTLEDDERLCEAFILEMPAALSGYDFAGKEIEVHLIEKVRDVQKFDSLEDLIAQIAKDVELISGILQNAPKVC